MGEVTSKMDKLGPYELNSIVTGDARELAREIPDESVNLIVTDPPYNVGKDYGEEVDDSLPTKDYLDWYGWICRESYRVMTDGYLYVSCTTNQLWELRPLWEAVGFSFQMLLMWHGPNYAGNSNTIRQQWRLLYEPIMMFLKGAKLPMLNEVRGYNTDAIMRHTRPQRDYSGELRRVHACQKPVGLYQNIIARTPGAIVLDWFVGSGSVMMAAKSLARSFIGFEMVPATADIARERVQNTQLLPPPLFILQPEQTEMVLETS